MGYNKSGLLKKKKKKSTTVILYKKREKGIIYFASTNRTGPNVIFSGCMKSVPTGRADPLYAQNTQAA